MIAIAGVGTSANQAAADFISDPKRIASVLQDAATGWERRNVQIILHANVIKDVPVSADVKAISID